MAKYVIIGNSIAAVGCIEGIRSVDTKNEIVVISDEEYFVYGRPLISYMLMGKTSLDKMNYRDLDFYEKNNVKLMLSKRATKIDEKKKEVLLDSGEKIAYEKLMVATGSSPFLPQMEGIENVKDKFSFMTINDALALEKVLDKNKKVLVIGAGLIGLKCVEGILDRVKSICVVDLANRVLPSILDEKGSGYVKKYLEKVGVEFILNDSVKAFSASKAELNSGKVVDFDILVTAVGVRPNVSLVQDIGGEVNRGIVIDANSKTSIEDIYAAGDCCVSHDISCDQDKVVAILPNAYFQGRSGGISMAGGECKFEKATPMNSIGFFKLHIVTAGSYIGDADVVSDDDNYKVLFTKDNKLKGFIMIGDVARAGIYTALVRDQVDLSTLDYDLIRKTPQLMAFTKEKRQVSLGRAH